MLVVFGFYALLLIYALLSGPGVLDHLSADLASASAPVQNDLPGQKHTPQPTSDHNAGQSHDTHETLQHDTHESPHVMAQEQKTHHGETSEEKAHADPHHHDNEAHGHSADESLMRHAPYEGLYQNTPNGPLPKTSHSGLTPFSAYKRPVAENIEVPVLSIGLIGYGLSSAASEMALKELPPEVSLVMSPYSGEAEEWQSRARKKGHELWLYIPMQTEKFPDVEPGPYGIFNRESLNKNKANMMWLLTRFAGYAGVAAYNDSSFASAKLMLQNLIRMGTERGLGYFEINPGGPLMIEQFVKENKAPYKRSEKSFNNVTNLSLLELEAALKSKPMINVTFELTPTNVKELSKWLKKMQDKGVTLVPLSYIPQH